MNNDDDSDSSVAGTQAVDLSLPGTSKSADKKPSLSAVASTSEGAIVLPFKKRPYVASETIEEKKVTPAVTRTASKKKETRKQPIAGISSDEFQTRCAVSDKTSKPVAASSADKKPAKTERKGRKKDTQKPSTSVHVQAEEAAPIAGTSASTAGTSASTSGDWTDHRLWIEIAQSHFTCSEYETLLRDAGFTEAQNRALRKAAIGASFKMSNLLRNINRYTKTHKCQTCHFSISHMCASMKFLNSQSHDISVFETTVIKPETLVICICLFAFFHSHTARSHREPVESDSSGARSTSRFREDTHSGNFTCRKCQTIIEIQYHDENTRYAIANWTSLDGGARKDFYESLDTFMTNLGLKKPQLKLFYSCSNECCLFFHPCVAQPSSDENSSNDSSE